LEESAGIKGVFQRLSVVCCPNCVSQKEGVSREVALEKSTRDSRRLLEDAAQERIPWVITPIRWGFRLRIDAPLFNGDDDYKL
jgi:hypothetical protein